MEKEKTTNWLPTDKRFVAFIDILGFKDLVMRSSHSHIYDLLSEISKLRSLIDNWKDKNDGRYSNAEMYTVSFSDSIVVFSKSDTVEDFDLFAFGIKWLFSGAIDKSIPLKGALAYGEISLNKSSQIYFGQPIIDAYLLEEEVNYFGIVAHNSIEKFFKDNEEKSVSKQILSEFKTPLKCGTISHLNLIWFKEIDNPPTDFNTLRNKIKNFQYNISGSPRRYIDNTINVIDQVENELK
ncbi:hypothetical protein BUL40_04680 [Croceivirga radicis]|uniref:Guanylate cyclase domain-containing protein n=1 Tax=Croceivirga radicis TaxID=1929488 RepID=A0A1V6LUQ2_9FLAO|nr:hypothetical protein [Croceivirga radicis]OQD43902.1 hypothetical protein BUL40_04680 [Croceivirga radicis]